MARRVTENTLERTARMLASGHKIRVIFKPGVAETVGDTITLPTLPDNANQELVDAMQGYLDQQAGYVLFADQHKVTALKRAAKKSKKEAQLWDTFRMVEDARVEESMEDIYPGSELNFTNAHHWLYNRLRDNWDETTDEGQAKITKYAKILAATFLERRHRGTDFFENFIDDEVQEKAQKCLDILKDVDPTTTEESLIAAKRIVEELEEEAKEDEGQRPEPGEGDGEEGDNQSPVSMAAAMSQNSGKDQGADAVQGQDDMAKALAQAAQQEIKGNSDNLSDNRYGRGDYTHGLDDKVGYTIFSTADDSIETMKGRNVPTHGDYLMNLREESRHLTSTMRQKLVNTLRASAKRRWVGGKPEGRLDVRRAHKAVLGISQDVYKVRTRKVYLDTAIALAIDHSGSMHGRPLELAAESAVVLGDVFDPLRIPFFIYGYSTQGAPRQYPASGEEHHFARYSNLWIRHYKDFDESWKAGALKLTHARQNCQANTLDGESVLYGIKHLLARPEKRKILLVFNDGAPYPGYGHVGRCQAYLKAVVTSGISAGVEIIAFGIHSPEVKEYYPDYVVINDLEDLVKEPLRKIDGMLRKGMLKAMR